MNFFALILLFCVLIFTSNWSHAFTLSTSTGAAFEQDQVKINVASHTCSNIGMTNAALLDLAVEAVDRFWNTVPTSRLRLERGSLVSVAAAFQTDGACTGSGSGCDVNPALLVSSDILISCNNDTGGGNNFSSTSTLALGVPNNASGKKITGALVLINDEAGSQFGSRSRDEVMAVLAHEIGHAIGLGHSEKSDSLMYYQSIATRFNLGEDDIKGVTWLYPVTQPDVLSCNSVAYVDNKKTPKGPFIALVLSGLIIGLFLSFLSNFFRFQYLRRFKS